MDHCITRVRVCVPLAVALLLASLAGSRSAGAIGYCQDLCSATTACTQSCLFDDVFITCGSYGLCGTPPPLPPPACTLDPCEGNACGTFPTDADCDGVPEPLEYDLAHRFFPAVLLQHAVPDINESYLKLGWATPYTVQPLLPLRHRCDEPYECLELRYAIAFRNDCGDFLPFESTSHCDASTGFPNYGHPGDSEFYVALVQRTAPWSQAQLSAASWVLVRDFTSAHWQDRGDSSRLGAYGDTPASCVGWGQTQCLQYPTQCRWAPEGCGGFPTDPYASGCQYYGSPAVCESFQGCYWYGGCTQRAPIRRYATTPLSGAATLYASEGKHALYHTDSECDSGSVAIPFTDPTDNCPISQYTSANNLRTYKGQLLQNVGWISDGSDGQASNCLARDTRFQHPNGCNSYEAFGGLAFAGASGYRSKFYYRFDWMLPPQ
jgi:hypothetical protein